MIYNVPAALNKLDDQPKKFTLYMDTLNTRAVELVIGVKADKKKVADSLSVSKIDKKHIAASGKCYKEGDTIVFKGRMQNGSAKATITRLSGASRTVVFRDPAPGEIMDDSDDELSDEEGQHMGDGQPVPSAQASGNANAPLPQQASNPPPLNRMGTFGRTNPNVQPAPSTPPVSTPPASSNGGGNAAPPRPPQRSGTLGTGTPPPTVPGQAAPQAQSPNPSAQTGQTRPGVINRTIPPLPATPQPRPRPDPANLGSRNPPPPVPTQAATANTRPPQPAPANNAQAQPAPANNAQAQPAQPATPPVQRIAGRNGLLPVPFVTVTPVPLAQKYSPDALKDIKKKTDRGFPKGMGDFKDVFSGVIQMQIMEQKSTIEPESRNKLINEYDALIGKITKYTNKFEADAGAKPGESGITKRKKTNLDGVRQDKLEFSEQALGAVVQARNELKKGQLQGRLQALAQKETQGTITPDEVNAYRETHAQLLMLNSAAPPKRADGGSSDTRLVRDPNNRVAYAFKSIEGESDEMDLPPGVGTANEVLTSKVAELIKGQTNMDFGFPKTTLASLPTSTGVDSVTRTGALIEGIAGDAIPERSELGGKASEKWSKLDDAEKQRIQAACRADATLGWSDKPSDLTGNYARYLYKEQADKVKALPPAAVQSVLVMNLASASFDIKWSNVMVDGNNAKPFDGGGCMLSPKKLKDEAFQGAVGSLQGDGVEDPTIGQMLLVNPFNQAEDLPVADAPMDANIMAAIGQLDADQIETGLKAETRRLQAADGRMAQNLTDDGAVSSANSIRCMKRGLANATQAAQAQNRPPTTKEFLDAYNAEMKNWLLSLPA